MNPYGLSLLASILMLPVSAFAAAPASEAAKQTTPATQSTQNTSTQSIAEKNLMEAQQYLDKNRQNPGVKTLPSGLQYEVMKENEKSKRENAPSPSASDLATVHYKGTLINGTEFDSSYSRNEPAEFPVNGVIPAWTEALQLMPVGSKWQLFVPSKLAYGERGAGGVIEPNSTLIFEVELLQIKGSGSAPQPRTQKHK